MHKYVLQTIARARAIPGGSLIMTSNMVYAEDECNIQEGIHNKLQHRAVLNLF